MSVVEIEEHTTSGFIIRNRSKTDFINTETVPGIIAEHARKRSEKIAIIDLNSGLNIAYGALWSRICKLSGGLLQFKFNVDTPIAILSENSIDHAVVTFAGMVLGIPVVPISVAYSQFSDLARIRSLFRQLTPGLVFAQDAQVFVRSLAVASGMGIPTVTSCGNGADHLLADLETVSGQVPDLVTINSDTIAKILFTSGSTGAPKGVIITQRMICSNQAAIAAEWPFVEDEAPTILDWLPWSHVYGGNLVIMCAIRNGGTLIIDDGRPIPGLFQKTIENLTKFRPTIHFGVPRGFNLLVPALEEDDSFARAYFSKLRRMFTAGAALPAITWNRYHTLVSRYANEDFVSHVAWGSTETSPLVTISPPNNTRSDNLGVPVQGCEIKMVPDDNKMELRLRGPMVTPGYWRNEKVTAEAFDEDGFYRIGDAGRLLDDDPAQGILFDGRISENFKLTTGTWVQVNSLRLATIDALYPAILDAVICGHNRDNIGALLFMNINACRQIAEESDAEMTELMSNPKLRRHLAEGLAKIGKCKGSSGKVERALILVDVPSQEDGEITDKGYLNQRAVLHKRAEDVIRVFEDESHRSVVLAKYSIN